MTGTITKTDTIIIGSGVAGAALAARLLQKDPNASIVMLEAGTRVEMRNFGLYQNYVVTGKTPYDDCQDWAYPTQDKPGENATNNTNVELRGARLMMYGGSTVHWGGWSFRMKPEDFKLKTNTGLPDVIDWPIDYNDLEPYYGQAEHYIGVSGNSDSTVVPRSMPYPYPAFPYTLEDEPMRLALEALKFEYDNMPIARHGMTEATDSIHPPCQTTGTCKYCPFGARYVAANYLDDLKRYNDYPNFHIFKQAFVQTILMGDKQTARGVEYLDQTTKQIMRLVGNRVIVAAGAIESAKLLLRSTSADWKNGIGNDHDLVGRNLITHPYFSYQAYIPSNPKKLQPEMNFPTLVSRQFDSPEEQAKGKFILMAPPGAPYINQNNATTSILNLMKQGYTRDEIDKLLEGGAVVQIDGIIETFSELRNRVENLPQINHLGLIETRVSYTQPSDFDERVKEVEARLEEIFGKMGATGMYQKMMSWRADHAACLTRMSDSPETGVVDKNLKVFGVDNLYVLSNASFSSLGAVNPTLTLAALSLRLGDHLNQQ